MVRWRHFVFAIGLVPALVIYLGIVLKVADHIENINIIIEALFYIVAGLAWVPLALKVVEWLVKHESS